MGDTNFFFKKSGVEYQPNSNSIFTNSRNKDGGGVLIGVQEELGRVAVDIKQENELFEAQWIKIDNRRMKIRIGVIYTPQENKCKQQEIEKIYRKIANEIRKAEVNGEKILIMGDFNCKIGKVIPSNQEKVSKAGKVLNKMCEDMDLLVLNSHKKMRRKVD